MSIKFGPLPEGPFEFDPPASEPPEGTLAVVQIDGKDVVLVKRDSDWCTLDNVPLKLAPGQTVTFQSADLFAKHNTVNKRKKMNWIARLWKQLWCKHEYEWVRNIHGEEIIFSSYHRSVWRCEKCEKVQTRQALHNPPQEPAGFGASPQRAFIETKTPLQELDEELEKITANPPDLIGDTGLTFEDAFNYYMKLVQVHYELMNEKARLTHQCPLGPPGCPGFTNVHQIVHWMKKIEANIDRLREEIVQIKTRLNRSASEIKNEEQQKESDAANEVLRIAQKYEL